jgi:hypothetical protein
MSEEVIIPSAAKWAIDLNWLKATGRSFSILARDTLCAKCRKKLKADSLEVKSTELLKTIQKCCSKSDNFITPGLPFQETIFRVILANGNKPITLAELGEALRQRPGIDVYRTSVIFLSRLMQDDVYYGIKCIPA